MSDDHLRTSRIVPVESERTQQTQKPEEAGRYAMMAESVEEEFNEWTELAAFNPIAMSRRFESLEVRTKRKGKEEETDKTEKEKVLEVKKLEEVSEQFERQNPELEARTLLLLRSRLSGQDTKESLLKKVLDTYPDYALADEALEFIIETSDAELQRTAREVREETNTLYSREIRAGKNIALQAREFSAQGLGSPTGLRDIYRDITGNPRDTLTLFEHLASKFNFDKMKIVIDFVLHSLGADLKAKGPSISRAELHRFLTEARNLQAILGVFRFFGSRMNLIMSSFQRSGLTLPGRIGFELLARLFMKYLQERYPTSEKVLQMAIQMGLVDEETGQVIIFTQMRDAIRQVAPKLYRTPQHRQDVLMSFIEALEELEEEEEEKEEEKK
jgi:type III secretion protein W